MIVIDPGDGRSSEDHPILRQCSRLVTEHVLDLPELLGDVHRPTLGSFVRVRVVEIETVVNDEDLKEFAALDGNVEREWN